MGSIGGNMKMALIGDEDTIALFKLAGILRCSSNYEDFEKFVNDGEIAILLITYDYAEKIKEKIIQHRLLKNFPFIIEIPSKKKIEREDTIKKLIVRAVGVEIEG